MITPGRLWWLLRRDLRRGWGASKHYYWTLPKIDEWKWPFWSEKPLDVPVHVLTGKDDWRLAAWMLASWFYFTEYSWPLVIHDDGTLPAEARKVFVKMFPNARIITRKEADAALESVLKPYPFCYEYRGMHPLALKLFDFPHFTAGSRYIILDSDVLFFTHPREIMDWVQTGATDTWFNEDVAEGSLLSKKEAMDELGVKLWDRVNTGLCLVQKAAIDIDLCDRALAQTSIMRGHIWRVEQTLYTVCASMAGKGGLLPKKYEVSLGKEASPGVTARHYVGAVRDRFFGEGLARLKDVLLYKE